MVSQGGLPGFSGASLFRRPWQLLKASALKVTPNRSSSCSRKVRAHSNEQSSKAVATVSGVRSLQACRARRPGLRPPPAAEAASASA